MTIRHDKKIIDKIVEKYLSTDLKKVIIFMDGKKVSAENLNLA